jgi:hypothetical protein
LEIPLSVAWRGRELVLPTFSIFAGALGFLLTFFAVAMNDVLTHEEYWPAHVIAHANDKGASGFSFRLSGQRYRNPQAPAGF